MNKKRELIIKQDHALIPLTQGKFAIIDLDDVDKVKNYNWHAQKIRNTYYAVRIENKKHVYLHHIVIPKKLHYQTDHEDRNGLNCRKNNLRYCTHRQNILNQAKHVENTSSKFKGVCWSKWHKKWMAKIEVKRQQIYLGFYNSEVEAAKIYDQAVLKHFGDFGITNNKLGLFA